MSFTLEHVSPMAAVGIVRNAGPVGDVHRLPVDHAPMKLRPAQQHYRLMARSGCDPSAACSFPSLSRDGEATQRSLPGSDLGVDDHVFRLEAAKLAKKIWQIAMLEILFA